MISASTAHEVRLLSDQDVQSIGLTVLNELSKRKLLHVYDIATKKFMPAGETSDTSQDWLPVCINGPSVQVNCDTSK